ncbi:MAG: RHS repeat protein, partial [Deltaproteobacteria bacterium]|nr:RHS repeat protein [Deltaproteobacteria bacterium]
MMHISPERKSIVAITLLSIVAIMIGCSSQHDTVATSEQYEYDRDGRLICKTTPDGSKIKYKYNKQGLPSEIEYPDDSVKYGYDANGNRIWMQNRNGKTEYKYDAFERLSEVIFKCSPEKKIVYEYDPWNRISSIRISDAQNNHYQVKYEYNILGNLVSIDDGNGRVEYNYSPAKGEIIRQLPNGIKTVFSYSPAGELISIKHSDSQNSLLAFYRYEYNPPGKISRVFEETSEALNITRFEWDNRGYLKNLQLPDGKSVHYEYDAMGNRISIKDSKGTIAYKYNGLGRLIEAGDTKFEWDGNGNLMTQIDNNTKTRFRYDARNLPQLVKTPNESFRYKWDGDGNIISRSVGKDINYYMPNPLAYPVFSLAEFDGTGKMKSSYLYGDSLLGQRDANGRMKYFLEDGFNSVRHITDTNGKIIGQQDFTPFAEHTSMKEETADNFRMMGERFLPEIKKSFIGNRLYDPSTGRYLSPDPEPGYIERPDSFNRYTHGSPNPSNFMEPRSNQTIEHQPTLGSIWQNLRSLPIGREKLDWPLNFVGRVFNLNWFGRNVTGGQWYVYDRDEQNQFSLGNTTIPGRNSFDMAARKHDIQYYINTHFDRGTWVQVPGPKGDEYFRSLGSTTVFPAWWTNIIVFRDMLLGNLAHHSGRTSLPLGQTAIPLRRDSAKSNDLHTGNYFKHGKRQLDEFYDDSRKYFFPPPPGCPPFCDDGGGASRPFGGGLYDPFKSIEAKLGGIKLDAAAQFTGNLDNITGAVYDQEKQVLVLVGDENKDKNISLPSIKPEDLAIALISVYGSEHISPQNPQFSLDPADPKNPRGEWLKAVYIPEQIIGGTEFGKALYEADWLLKQYSFGVTLDAEGKMQERKSSVPGLKSTADLSYEEKDREHGKERWNRFWIVSDDMKLKQSGKSIYFDTAKMRVKAKKQVPDPRSPTGLSDVDSEDDPVATKFAKGFTDLYDEIAKESPEFERVRQLAKAVAIAKWMKQERIPFDTGWVNEYANKRIDTVGRVTALSTQWEKSNQTPFQRGNQSGILTQIHKIHLFGGVDLTVNPKFISDDGNAQRLQKAVTAKLREKVVGPTFYVNHNGKAYRAVILPVTSQGQAIWKNSPTTTINGTRYQFNKQGDVA